VSSTLHLTTSKDVLENIAQQQGPEDFILILGYAGWDAGQLELEIQDNHWLLVPADAEIIFHTPPELRWALSAQSIGIDKSHLSSQIGHA